MNQKKLRFGRALYLNSDGFLVRPSPAPEEKPSMPPPPTAAPEPRVILSPSRTQKIASMIRKWLRES